VYTFEVDGEKGKTGPPEGLQQLAIDEKWESAD
jgi:hypothetical protein